MNRNEYKGKKRQAVCVVESLDDRLLLSTIPPTRVPAPSPVNVVRLEHRIERMDRVFKTSASTWSPCSTLGPREWRRSCKRRSAEPKMQVQAVMAAAATAAAKHYDDAESNRDQPACESGRNRHQQRHSADLDRAAGIGAVVDVDGGGRAPDWASRRVHLKAT